MSDLSLDAEQLDRYSRHIIMDEVGSAGQQRLLDASVLCIGAGGLGSPVIQYLAAAGVGTLGIADDDVVERSNLQRQVIHGDDDVGRPKVDSAREFVEAQNPDVEVRTHGTRVTAGNVEGLLDAYDVVVDGSDNFETRYLVNDACTLAGVPFCHGAILRFEGQVATFEPPADGDGDANGDGDGDGDANGDGDGDAASRRGPCYRCLFPEAPEPGTVPDCATAGVLGVLPGTVGCIQATEAVKLLVGYGESLHGRMVFYDAAEMTFQEIGIDRRPDCPICSGAVESVREVDYRATCAI